jgi:hypothetical protein
MRPEQGRVPLADVCGFATEDTEDTEKYSTGSNFLEFCEPLATLWFLISNAGFWRRTYTCTWVNPNAWR